MQFQVDSTSVDLNRFNPLSKVRDGNPWTTQFENQNLLREIKLDVDRTYQEIEFYNISSGSDNCSSLSNILFVFSKSEQLPYRQGMNEIAAIFFYVSAAALHHLDRDSREGVAYSLFLSLMITKEHANMFFPTRMVPRSSPQISDSKTTSPLLECCDRIFAKLERKDITLHRHLLLREISPNLFLLRWIRVLFAREFGLEQILLLWDFLFSQDWPIENFALAMIMHVRGELLVSDNAGCFTTLLHYPKIDSLDPLFGLTISLIENRPIVAPSPQVTRQPSTRREMILIELLAVIESLKTSPSRIEVAKEITRLESIANVIRTGNK
jgi:hypothetical protein